jgi:DNA-binding MarR family transcriptional regulator
MSDEPLTPEPKTPDPKKLRALAHPLRWQLIELLGMEGSATATRCAEVLGESVASCSYHLGILAKYDYIEEAPGRTGREKPWRLTSTEQDLSSEGLDAESELAAEAATEAFLDHELARTKQRLRRKALEPEQWRPKLLGETTWLTEEEYAAVWRELHAVLERYRRDWGSRDLSRRPPGSRGARLFIAASALPPLPEPPAKED